MEYRADCVTANSSRAVDKWAYHRVHCSFLSEKKQCYDNTAGELTTIRSDELSQ